MKGAEKFNTNVWGCFESEGQRLKIKFETYFSSSGGFAAQLENRLNTVRQEVPFNVEVLGVLNEGGDLWRGEMRFLEFLGDTERGHQRPRIKALRV